MLTDHINSSAGVPLKPGELYVRVMKAISKGLLIREINGLEINDPCETETKDVLASIEIEKRLDLTAIASLYPQHLCK